MSGIRAARRGQHLPIGPRVVRVNGRGSSQRAGSRQCEAGLRPGPNLDVEERWRITCSQLRSLSRP